MDESLIARLSKRIIPIQSWIQRWSTRIVPEKPPNETFREEQQQSNANLDATYEKYKSEGTPDSFCEVERCMQRWKALALQFEATREARERDYQQREWNRQESFVNRLLDILGNPPAVAAIVQQLVRACEHPASITFRHD
ncbi:hypothetical protein FOMA001_g2409 [Fusarium oxysporum f. sp. matthiolae]|nr:hypothetical protein FOMA001_g2409 [Fusarium oxysporum f. sp. matthiolae]